MLSELSTMRKPSISDKFIFQNAENSELKQIYNLKINLSVKNIKFGKPIKKFKKNENKKKNYCAAL